MLVCLLVTRVSNISLSLKLILINASDKTLRFVISINLPFIFSEQVKLKSSTMYLP